MFKSIPSLCLALPLLLACSTTNTGEPRGAAAFADDPRLGDQVKSICFNRNIDGFTNAERDTIVLTKGVSDEYLVEVFGNCTNLRHAQSIGIDATNSCVRRNDYLIVSESAFSLKDSTGLGPQRCAIEAMYKWDKDAKDETDEKTGETADD